MAINVDVNDLLLMIGSQHVQIQALERQNADLEKALKAAQHPVPSVMASTGAQIQEINGLLTGASPPPMVTDIGAGQGE